MINKDFIVNCKDFSHWERGLCSTNVHKYGNAIANGGISKVIQLMMMLTMTMFKMIAVMMMVILKMMG